MTTSDQTMPPPLIPIDNGYRVKETEDYFIEVYLMLFNWRVVRSYKRGYPLAGWDRGWCYFGTDAVTLIRAALAAYAWDGADDTEPFGYDKAVGAAR